MGLIFGLVKRLIKFSLYFATFVAIIVLIPNLPPYTKFTSIKLEPTQALVGPLAWNEALNNPEILYKDKLLGPEAFQIHNGELYTSLATGEIVKISPGGHVTFVTKIGQPCAGLAQEHICGRPLGFSIDAKTNQLYVADAYHGIWKVDLKTDKKQLLVSPRVAIGGRQPMLFNAIALADNGDFYWTDSTSDFLLKDGAYAVATDPSGRLFYYNAAKNESKVLLDDLWFANGVAVSPDKQFVVVAETSRFRVMKYYISGPKKGKSEVFVAGLPGTPDNIQVLPDGSGFLLALYSAFDEQHPLVSRSLSELPAIRKFLVRLQRLVEIPFQFLDQQFPHPIFEGIVYYLGSFKSITALLWNRTGLVQLDWNGNIVAAYYREDDKSPHLSDAIVFNNKLYTGAPHSQDYIAAVPVPPLLKKAFAQEKAVPKPKVAATTQQPKVEPVKTAKPKVEEKRAPPKEEKKELPKAKPQEVPKPTAAPTTTTTPKPKPTEAPTTPKPIEKKPASPASSAPKVTSPPPPKVTTPPPPPKVTTPPPPPKVQPKPAEAKPAAPKQPEPKSAPAQDKPKTEAPAAKNAKPEANKPAEPQKPQKSKPEGQPAPKQIPIEEEIPSDTAKPSKETLKVITKGGPTEIPNPNNV